MFHSYLRILLHQTHMFCTRAEAEVPLRLCARGTTPTIPITMIPFTDISLFFHWYFSSFCPLTVPCPWCLIYPRSLSPFAFSFHCHIVSLLLFRWYFIVFTLPLSLFTISPVTVFSLAFHCPSFHKPWDPGFLFTADSIQSAAVSSSQQQSAAFGISIWYLIKLVIILLYMIICLALTTRYIYF